MYETNPIKQFNEYQQRYNHQLVRFSKNIYSKMKDKDDENCYFNRAWCRIELLYANTIPLVYQQHKSQRKHLFQNTIFESHLEKGKRIQFLYSSSHHLNLQLPSLLPPLLDSSFLITHFHPGKGYLTNSSDLPCISQLLAELQKSYLHEHYEGSRTTKDDAVNPNNKIRHGFGICRYGNGDVYEGHWENNLRHGEGTFIHGISSNVYSGIWKYNCLYQGVVDYVQDGSSYEGNLYENVYRHGYGEYTDSHGNKTCGFWYLDQLYDQDILTERQFYHRIDDDEADDRQLGELDHHVLEKRGGWTKHLSNGFTYGLLNKVMKNGDIQYQSIYTYPPYFHWVYQAGGTMDISFCYWACCLCDPLNVFLGACCLCCGIPRAAHRKEECIGYVCCSPCRICFSGFSKCHEVVSSLLFWYFGR